jgi:hypothetical protein
VSGCGAGVERQDSDLHELECTGLVCSGWALQLGWELLSVVAFGVCLGGRVVSMGLDGAVKSCRKAIKAFLR